jgi:lactoylglutathione lyase
MRARLELFVEDMETSIGFYTRVLGFEVAHSEPGDYASLRNGDVVLGIGRSPSSPRRTGTSPGT